MGVMFISDHAKHAWSRGGNRCGRVDPSPEFYDVGDCGVGGVCFGGDGGVVEAFRDGREGHKCTSPGACVDHCGEDGRPEMGDRKPAIFHRSDPFYGSGSKRDIKISRYTNF